jgi:hypothetical protein
MSHPNACHITLNTPESTQIDCHANASQQQGPGQLSVAIDVIPHWPEHIATQAQAAEHIKQALSGLVAQGF